MKNSKETNRFITVLKIGIFILLVISQVYILTYIYSSAKDLYIYYNSLFMLIKFIAVLFIICKHYNPVFKISWLIFIMFMPVIGVLVYLLFTNSKMPRYIIKRLEEVTKKTKKLLSRNKEVEQEIKQIDSRIYNSINYITNTSQYPVYANSKVEYLPLGEIYFSKMIEDMKQAKKYIFLEYFIVAEGVIFDRIYEVLKERVQNGVKVYFMYDGIGSMFKVPKHIKKKFNEAGIKYKIFNRVTAIVTAYLNNRDHRKLTVIDGTIAYSGGINIGDEYANIKQRIGHWKDNGIRVEGPCVKSYIVMFIRMWNIYKKDKISYNLDIPTYECQKTDGYIIPFGDGPYNLNNPGESIYIDTINKAKDYIYITSPYLIIDNELLLSLCKAAKSGVDVRIMLPGIPDKKLVYISSRSFYGELLKSGVKIYEYTPGFLHAKMFISDDDISIIGTINLDFRSLYLHYELATYLYKTSVTKPMKKDFLSLVKESREIKLEQVKKQSLITRFIAAILRAFSPLL